MMKKYLICVIAAMAMFAGCNKPDDNGGSDNPAVITLEVTDIADNCATVKASVSSGSANGAKVIDCMLLEDVTFDYTNDIQLINYVEKNGVAVQLPYEKKLTDVKVGKDMFTAIIVYNDKGVVSATKTCIWTPVGEVDGWSGENNPGDLGEIIW